MLFIVSGVIVLAFLFLLTVRHSDGHGAQSEPLHRQN
jgi:hypothetical protein